jgi:hypothetical protein
MRSGHPYVQALLVQAAWRVCRSSDPRVAGLRRRAHAIARRRGKKIAIVALARRLARILYAMWRDGTDYQPAQIRMHQTQTPVAAGTQPATVSGWTDEVVKLEEQARRCTWPRVRAAPKRALLLPRIISCAGTGGATDRARIKVGATSLCEGQKRLATRRAVLVGRFTRSPERA